MHICLIQLEDRASLVASLEATWNTSAEAPETVQLQEKKNKISLISSMSFITIFVLCDASLKCKSKDV